MQCNRRTPEEQAAAYDLLIDRLLESSRYGERWGRHWLDVAGYADCDGNKRGNGCETATATDPLNCGACNRACPARNGAATCQNATCGIVCDAGFGDCNGDQAVRESVANAVYRSSPLPAPRDARAFERRLVIVFKPTE